MTNWAGDGEKAAAWWINNLLKGRHRLTYRPPAGIRVLIIITFRGFCYTIAGRTRQKQGKESYGLNTYYELGPLWGAFMPMIIFDLHNSPVRWDSLPRPLKAGAEVSTTCPRSQNQRAVKRGFNHLTPTLVLRKQQKGLSWGTAPLSG